MFLFSEIGIRFGSLDVQASWWRCFSCVFILETGIYYALRVVSYSIGSSLRDRTRFEDGVNSDGLGSRDDKWLAWKLCCCCCSRRDSTRSASETAHWKRRRWVLSCCLHHMKVVVSSFNVQATGWFISYLNYENNEKCVMCFCGEYIYICMYIIDILC